MCVYPDRAREPSKMLCWPNKWVIQAKFYQDKQERVSFEAVWDVTLPSSVIKIAQVEKVQLV